MKRFSSSLACIYLCLGWALITQSVGAAEFFVKKSGDDRKSGNSKANAWATIQRGLNALAPGDILTICPGDYHEAVRREALGSREIDTIIRAEIPGTVVLRGDVPAPEFRKVDGIHGVFEAAFPSGKEVSAINELDTLQILDRMPNPGELEFAPGRFYYDKALGKLYLSTSDGKPPAKHSYTVSVIPNCGLYLANPIRVVVEGLSATGFNAMGVTAPSSKTMGSIWGFYFEEAQQCVIRDCRAYLNGQGIGINSGIAAGVGPEKTNAGGNLIERCEAWGNRSRFLKSDAGGITIYKSVGDEVRDSKSYLNADYGINFYGGGPKGKEIKNRSVMRGCLAWGNRCDFKIKTGHEYSHLAERCVGPGLWSLVKPRESIFGFGADRAEREDNNIVLRNYPDLDLADEFADPENHDYRLQSTSRFRKAGPDGRDQGPYQFEAKVYFIKPDGSDNVDGCSAETAWGTLGKAASELKPGDTLYLLPGRYVGNAELKFRGTIDAPIFIRGRGMTHAVIEGAVTIRESCNVELERLYFRNEVTLVDSENISLKKCQFSAPGVGLNVETTEALYVTHCEFTEFRDAAIVVKSPSVKESGFYLSGNIYNNRQGPALRLSSLSDLSYTNHNSYRDASAVWDVGGEAFAFHKVKQLYESQSHLLAADFRPANGNEPAVLQNPEIFLGKGPHSRALGIYRETSMTPKLGFVEDLAIHSVSATTANLEWRTTLPAVCEIAWGETEQDEKTAKYEVNRFGTYSLIGLKPGRKYFFKIKSLAIPDELVEEYGKQKVETKGGAIFFATKSEDAKPTQFYVASDGDDQKSGLDRANAWRTIAHAADRVNVGDTVLIAGGTYEERVRIRSSGAEGSPITFKAIPGEKVFIDGAGGMLNQAFVVGGKWHLRFDALYFKDFNFFPSQSWRLANGAEFQLYEGGDIEITRCFSDGRGDYSARLINAWNIRNLTVSNCVAANKMSGSLFLVNCPDLLIRNTVFIRPLNTALVLRNEVREKAVMEGNIFTDPLKKKEAMNLDLFAIDRKIEGLSQINNCYFLRGPSHIRKLMGRRTLSQLVEQIHNPIFADPQFKGAESNGRDKDSFSPDLLMEPNLDLDFDSFFATNPEIIKRGIGLQREAFADFKFKNN